MTTAARPPRMTGPTMAVLRVFLDAPEQDRYGLELGSLASLPSGTVHPILARLEALGWLTSGWEQVDPRAAGRPQRRYYRLTETGAGAATEALARAQHARAQLGARLRPAEGLP